MLALGRPGLSPEELKARAEEEGRMVAEMREIVDTNARRNDLESYILTMRGSIGEGAKYGPFITAADRAKLADQLQKAEDWLYEHPGEPKQVFIDKLAELKVLGGPVEHRAKEDEHRKEAVASFEKDVKALITAAQKQAISRGRNGDVSQVRSLESACYNALRWLGELREKQGRLARTDNPVLTTGAIQARREELNKLADTVLEGREADGSDLVPPSPLVGEDGGDGGRPRAMDVD